MLKTYGLYFFVNIELFPRKIEELTLYTIEQD